MASCEHLKLEVLKRVVAERDAQDFKWSREPGHWPLDDGMKLAVLGEEYGEVARAILEHDLEQLERELVQLVAVGVCWLEVLEASRIERKENTG